MKQIRVSDLNKDILVERIKDNCWNVMAEPGNNYKHEYFTPLPQIILWFGKLTKVTTPKSSMTNIL